MAETLTYLVSPTALALIALGTALGIVVGAIPGMTGAMLIALSLPLTFTMDGVDAMTLLVSMYVGSVSGGLVSATLLNIPGTPASIITTLDGYPLARSGKAGRALGLGISASFFGGLISWVFLVALAGPISAIAHTLGPFEFFALVLMALALIALVEDSMLKGLASGFLGVFAAMPGTSPVTGDLRMTFGYAEMDDGFKLLPVLIGLYALSEAFHMMTDRSAPKDMIKATRRGMLMSGKDLKDQAINLIRSSVLGTWIGALPGIGANVGSVTAYTAAKRFSKTRERFGHGAEEGIVASESANNATVAGALIPLISLGIPGSVIDAILLGAMVVHGLQPGPLLMSSNPGAVHAIIGSVFISNLLMAVFMVASAPWLTRLARVPKYVLIPAVLVFCVVGSYGLANRMFDVFVMLGFGLVGLALRRVGLGLAPFAIGFVLGPLAEENLGSGLMATNGDWSPLFTRPVPCILILATLAMVAWPMTARWRGRERV